MPESHTSISVRPIDYQGDRALLKSFLTPYDAQRLDQIQPAIENGDGFVVVAVKEHLAIGWVVMHTRYREDQGWYVDENTMRFQYGENAYIEYLEVEVDMRGRGIGRMLLAAAEDAARQIGKRILWLHTGDQNTGAHRLYEREGWAHFSTVFPLWYNRAAMRVYRKEIGGDA